MSVHSVNMVSMEPNVPLLRKIVEWVEEQDQLPEGREWYQGGWFTIKRDAPWCGTAMCVAGKVALDAGWKQRRGTGSRVVRDNEEGSANDVARDLLGLNDWQAEQLFSGGNDVIDIRRFAEKFAGERL